MASYTISLKNIFQPGLNMMLITGVQTFETSEVEDFVIATTTAEDKEVVYHSQCARMTNIAG